MFSLVLFALLVVTLAMQIACSCGTQIAQAQLPEPIETTPPDERNPDFKELSPSSAMKVHEDAQQMPPDAPSGRIVAGELAAPSLANNILGDPAQKLVLVYLPPSYDKTDDRYPVVYFLPGYGTEVASFTQGLFQGFVLQDALEILIKREDLAEMIIVIPRGQHRYGGSFYVNSPVTGNWEDFIVRDVVEYVDESFRTIDDPKFRGISGHSMGGYGALNLAMLHPDVFSAAYALSPGLFDEHTLANSQIFGRRYLIDAFLDLQEKLAGLSREEAHQEFETYMQKIKNPDIRFAVNYGMAFSPDASVNAPYVAYPYHRQNNYPIVDPNIMKKWGDGCGGVHEEAELYRKNLPELTHLAIDYGKYHDYSRIPEGCEFFAEVMRDVGVPTTEISFTGGHSDQLRERIEDYLLPFFSDLFSTQAADAAGVNAAWYDDTEMILIPGGEFMMGSNGEADHSPAHKVQIDTFYIDKYEVTNAEYMEFCDAGGGRLPEFWEKEGFRCGPDYPDHPVVGVSWYSAQAYAQWRGKRLPTEAEWEYAARGGLENAAYPHGDEINSPDANYARSETGGTLPVGSYQPNGFGLYDMTGNAGEWVQDYYGGEYYSESPSYNPTGPESGKFAVFRGGGWHTGPGCCRVFFRNALPPNWLDFNIGFRCAKDWQTDEDAVEEKAPE